MQGKVPSFGSFNALIPKGGPRYIPLQMDFTGGVTSQSFDLVLDEMLKIMEFVQGVFIDNSESEQPLYFTVSNSQQVIKLQPGWQGYFPLLSPNPPRITIQSAGGVVIPIILYNMPLPACAWPSGVSASFNFNSNGQLIVSDPNLDALINDFGQGDALNVNALTGLMSVPSDTFANPAVNIAFEAVLSEQWNEATWERIRGNTQGTAIASANRASGTVTNSADILVQNAKSISIFTNISATVGGNVTVKLQLKDPVSGLYVDVPGAVTTALAGVSANLLQVGPGITPVANLSVAALLGRTIRITQTTGGGANITNSVGYQLTT